MSLLSILGEAGITFADIDKATAESFEIRQGVIDKAKEVQEYWKSIAPVNKVDKPHDLGDGRIDDPGDYRDSIVIKYGKSRGFSAEVRSDDPKAHWLEYGTTHNPEHGYAQRVRDHFSL
jgi:hypothetical protein